jgi:hypothetical protein
MSIWPKMTVTHDTWHAIIPTSWWALMPFGALDTKRHSRFDPCGVKYTICTYYKYTEASVAASTANYGSFPTMTRNGWKWRPSWSITSCDDGRGHVFRPTMSNFTLLAICGLIVASSLASRKIASSM